MRIVDDSKYLVISTSYGLYKFKIDENNKESLSGEKMFPITLDEEDNFEKNDKADILCFDFI